MTRDDLFRAESARLQSLLKIASEKSQLFPNETLEDLQGQVHHLRVQLSVAMAGVGL